MLSMTHIRGSANDITTLPIIGSIVIFQEVGYSGDLTFFLSLRRQTV